MLEKIDKEMRTAFEISLTFKESCLNNLIELCNQNPLF